MLTVLIDPDKAADEKKLLELLGMCAYAKSDFIFVGGSLMVDDRFEEVVQTIKANTKIPVIIFPGSPLQISKNADALLFLSLISGRNPELLIGNHVIAAPYLKKAGIETLSTGYILIDCGSSTTVSYISNTLPVPYNKPEIAACTALAGEMLGLSLIYLDGGSGAQNPVSEATIATVKKQIAVPLIVGGGIRSFEEAAKSWEAGADMIVIGTAIEKDPELLLKFSSREKSQI